MDLSLVLPWGLCAAGAIYIAYQRRALALAATATPEKEEEPEVPELDPMQLMITTHVLEALIKILPPATSQEEFKGYAADAARKFIEVRAELIQRMEDEDADAEHDVPMNLRSPTLTQDDVLINPPSVIAHSMALEYAVDRASMFIFRHGFPALKSGEKLEDFIKAATLAQRTARSEIARTLAAKYPAPVV